MKINGIDGKLAIELVELMAKRSPIDKGLERKLITVRQPNGKENLARLNDVKVIFKDGELVGQIDVDLCDSEATIDIRNI